MSIDLETSLARLARSVHDDHVAARMSGRVRHMVSRIRRRRAARHTATGLVAVGAVAAVAVTGMQLASRNPSPVPPATQPTTGWSAPACGETIVDPYPTADWVVGVDIEAPTQAESGSRLDVSVSFTGTQWSDVAIEGPAQLFLVRDGVVVASAAELVGVDESFPPRYGFSQALTSCDQADAGEPLPAGTYELYAVQAVTFPAGDGPVELFASRAVTITWSEGDATQLELQAQLEAILAAAPGPEPFPSCGSLVPTGDDLPLALELTLEDRVYDSGEIVAAEATVRTTAGRTVIANAPTSGALIVLVRDGVVVGRGYWDPEDVDILDLGPNDTAAVQAMARLSLCTIPLTEAGGPDLPAGTYQAYAVIEVMLKEVTEADGEAYSRSDLVAARSNPVEITIG